jgi:DNA-binding transcriptional regulator YiaG
MKRHAHTLNDLDVSGAAAARDISEDELRERLEHARQLKELRRRLNLSIAGLADRWEASRSTLEKWEGMWNRVPGVVELLLGYELDATEDIEPPVPGYKDPDVLHQMRCVDKLPIRKIADKLDCSTSTVTKYLGQFDIDCD